MPKAFYRRNLPHLQRDDKPHFVTFCTFNRNYLTGQARSIVLEVCLCAHGWTIDLHIAVIMPDHAHLIFVPLVDRERAEIFSLARIMKAIKGASAHRINRELGHHGRVWQEESFDRVLRISEKLDEKIEYVAMNPVRKGLANTPDDYAWLWIAPAKPSCFARPGR